MDFVKEINEAPGEVCAVSEIIDKSHIDKSHIDKSHIVAVCTPFMKRVHTHIQESGEVVFIDSSGGIDRDGYRIFLVMTHSKAGGLCFLIQLI